MAALKANKMAEQKVALLVAKKEMMLVRKWVENLVVE
jgi:hypothetical protein